MTEKMSKGSALKGDALSIPPTQPSPAKPGAGPALDAQITLAAPCPYCVERDDERAYRAKLAGALNAALADRDILTKALEQIARPTRCSGPMTKDEHGKPFSPQLAEAIRIAHARHCVRCVARAAIDSVKDFGAPDGKLLEPVDDLASIGRVLAEIRIWRAAQDAQWGGPAHDDTHGRRLWVPIIQKFLGRADVCAIDARYTGDADARVHFEKHLLHVAALAVAAIQSSRRRRRADAAPVSGDGSIGKQEKTDA